MDLASMLALAALIFGVYEWHDKRKQGVLFAAASTCQESCPSRKNRKGFHIRVIADAMVDARIDALGITERKVFLLRRWSGWNDHGYRWRLNDPSDTHGTSFCVPADQWKRFSGKEVVVRAITDRRHQHYSKPIRVPVFPKAEAEPAEQP